ncbi:hypothetical protein C900_05226 [Fulvivirga imtechensis AK7]|uniref:Uncharacterized protein n=1 Tax=Fulvivirga imtechensis AK7 TaxID=1237149 RepID=L8K149_9BACT|nr:hypothetical protein C900_05226 [Fulvivirga imtechensis AK7]
MNKQRRRRSFAILFGFLELFNILTYFDVFCVKWYINFINEELCFWSGK